jgi:hypothetical protein
MEGIPSSEMSVNKISTRRHIPEDCILQITVLKHPISSPDLAPNDFYSVPEDKGNIERKAY